MSTASPKLVPEVLGITLEQAIDQSPELRSRMQVDSQVQQLIETALSLEGLTAEHPDQRRQRIGVTRNHRTRSRRQLGERLAPPRAILRLDHHDLDPGRGGQRLERRPSPLILSGEQVRGREPRQQLGEALGPPHATLGQGRIGGAIGGLLRVAHQQDHRALGLRRFRRGIDSSVGR